MQTNPPGLPSVDALQLGRYSVLHPLGAGAMGIVYAAYDPELDRRVALKLLHAAGGDAQAQRTRLLREAQAMARLSHPNVIAVHDVGTVGEQVFVAMEFVEGKTLAGWLASGPRPWRETLRLFLLAGHGLAAAHAAGIVHRDFKPENVMVGDDGRVRVTDFGLARAESREALGPEALGQIPAGTSSLGEGSQLSGSPAYMAPEQIRGEKVDARADQFSFCVALYGALYGEPPFAGGDLRARAEEIEQRRVRKEPDGTRVPGWIRRVILRGLSPEPAARFPTLGALLDSLEKHPAARWRRLGAALSVVALIAIVAFATRWQLDRSARACRGAEEKLRGVWDPELRAKGQTAFATTGLAYAGAAWERTSQELDRYAAAWVAMRTDACEATAVRKEQTPELLDLRMACLDERLRDLGAASAIFASADRDVVSKAINVVNGLGPLAGCADAAALRAPVAPPPEKKAAVDALNARIAQTWLRATAGKPSVADGEEIRAAAAQLAYPPLVAESLFTLGHLEHLVGDEKAATTWLREATAAALSAKSDLTLAEAWINLLAEYIETTQLEQADRAAQQATAAVNRLGELPKPRAELDVELANLARTESKLEDALRYNEDAVAILERHPADNRQLAISAVGDLGVTLTGLAHWERGLAMQQKAFELAVAYYGPDHPMTGEMEEQLGANLSSRERMAEARPHLVHALHVLESALGPDHPAVSDALNFLAATYINVDAEKAIPLLQRALRIQGIDKGENNSAIVFSLYLLGDAYMVNRQLKSARETFDRAHEMEWGVQHDPNDLELAMVESSLAALDLEENNPKAARPLLERALAAQEKGFGRAHPQTGDTLALFGRLALQEHRLRDARRFAEEALAIGRKDEVGDSAASLERELLLADITIAEGHPAAARASLERIAVLPRGSDAVPFDLAQARFLLAQSLWPEPAQRPRALALARQALDGSGGKPSARELAEVRAWLQTHAK